MESWARDPQPGHSAGEQCGGRAGEQFRRGRRPTGAKFRLTEAAANGWVPERADGIGAEGGLSSLQRAEVARLRRENSRLRAEVEVLRSGYRDQMVSWLAALERRNRGDAGDGQAGEGGAAGEQALTG